MYKINLQGGIYIPGKPTHSHVRSFIIDLFTTGQTYSEIAAAVRVGIKTVKNIVTKCINTGLYEPGKPPGKEQYVCNLDTMQFIKYLKFERPSITANEIQQDLINTNAIHIPAESTINRVL